MSLHIKQQGSGPSLVMLHGWGGNSGVWASVRDQLAEHFQLTMIDLPGHGMSEFNANDMQDIASLADCIAGQIEQPAFWLGWSLGGMVAITIAQRHPEKVNALITVASTPRFLQADDWPDAVEASVLTTFSKELQNDPHATLARFIALQTRGSEMQRDDARILKQALLGADMAQPAALQAGLDLLEKTDLRAGLKDIICPALIVTGDRDTLHSVTSMQAYAELLPTSRLQIISKAGHAPFISHKNEFVNSVLTFLKQHSDSLSKSA